MVRPMMLLVNPAAGRSTSSAALGGVVETLCRGGWAPTVFFTTGPRTATALARQWGSEYELLMCLGGDGTLSETIAGLMQLPEEKRPLLGYIPMGTANDVANTLNLPRRRPRQATHDALNGREVPYDVGQMGESGYFTYVAAFGVFTEVSYKTDQELKKALGHAAYVLSGLSQLPKLRATHARVEYDDGVLEDDFIYGAVSNSTSIAGLLKLDKRVVALSDGKFELVLVRRPKTLTELSGIIQGLLNMDYNGPGMTIVQTSRVHFSFPEPVAFTRDGEAGGIYQELEIVNPPRAVNFIL